MRYKAYYNKTDIANWQPGQRPENYETDVLMEDDDIHILQSRLREMSMDKGGIAFIQRVKIVDTLYEDRFNAKQGEMQSQMKEIIEQCLLEIVNKYNGKSLNSESILAIKNDLSKMLTQHPSVGITISSGEIFIKHVGQNTYELKMPVHNVDSIQFTL